MDHTAHYTLEIARGMPEGHEVVFEGEGDESPDWEAGDVVLRVRSRKEKGGWRRKESSLYWKQPIGVDEVRHDFFLNGRYSWNVAVAGVARIRTQYHAPGWTHGHSEKRRRHPTRLCASCQRRGNACVPRGQVW